MEDEYGFGDPPETQDPIEEATQEIQSDVSLCLSELGYIKSLLLLLVIVGIIALIHFW